MSSQLLFVIVLIVPLYALLRGGVQLRRGARPYPARALALHKLLAVGIVIALIVRVFRAREVPGLTTPIWYLAALAGLLLLAALGTGGALGATGEAAPALKLAHRSTSIAGTLLAVVVLALLW
ncbi:hypothetical protein KDL67_10410 [bacterium]|nr:hypothetical protein [bacterium]